MFYLANVIKSIPSEYSSFSSIDVSHGMCQRGSCFQYMWSRSGSNPHSAFTLRNLTHLLGSKLPQSGSFDPHRIHIVNVGSNPLILCSHYTGKWFRCRVDPRSLHQKVLMWSRPNTAIIDDITFSLIVKGFNPLNKIITKTEPSQNLKEKAMFNTIKSLFDIKQDNWPWCVIIIWILNQINNSMDIAGNISTLHEAILIIINETTKNKFKPIRHSFSDEFIISCQ